jgi:hypothetical protein
MRARTPRLTAPAVVDSKSDHPMEPTMLERLMPIRFDNAYGGWSGALWILGALLLAKLIMSANVVFNGASVATRADGLPLAGYPTEAARTVLAMFALWGIAHFVLCLPGVLALWRYRSMVPLAFALLLLEHALRRAYLATHPVQRAEQTHAAPVNLVLLILTVLGLALSLWPAPGRP